MNEMDLASPESVPPENVPWGGESNPNHTDVDTNKDGSSSSNNNNDNNNVDDTAVRSELSFWKDVLGMLRDVSREVSTQLMDILYQHSLHCINTPYIHTTYGYTVSTPPIDTLYPHTLSIYCINTPYINTPYVSIYYINTPYTVSTILMDHTVSSHPTLYPHFLSTFSHMTMPLPLPLHH